jgi:putative restriction endonuclease
MLVASHIKPWRHCSSAERLDVRNGLTACPTHDVAFDTGLITVNGGLRIHVTVDLAQFAVHDPAARAAFGRPPLCERLLLPDGAAPPSDAYLTWHHEKIYHGPVPTS